MDSTTSIGTVLQFDTAPSPTPTTRTAYNTIQTTSPSLTPTSAMASATAVGAGAHTSQGEYSLAFKVGISIIPVAVVLCVISIFVFFWLRRRRARRSFRYPPSHPDLEKRPASMTSSDTQRQPSTSKVLNMTAFSIPLEGTKNDTNSASNLSPRLGINMAPARLEIPDSVLPDLDSPIDQKSPFRLKRGNTTKRCSLGSAMLAEWPVPPESAWIKQPNIAEGLLTPIYDAEKLHTPIYDAEKSLRVPRPRSAML